jgi:hypothetical protein
VTVKLLPFDNKSEIAVVLDLAERASLEETERTLFAIAAATRALPEIRSTQLYAGTAAPFNFNGLVRHSYLRAAPELGELQINLAPRAERSRTSHAIALDLRERLKAVALPAGAVAKVVEVPPGPPVLATLLAEIYAAPAHRDRPGPARVLRGRAARRVRHAAGAARRDTGRLFAPWRRPQPDRNRGSPAEARPRLDRDAGLDAGAGECVARQPHRRGARRRGAGDA